MTTGQSAGRNRRGAHPAATQRFSSAFPPARQSAPAPDSPLVTHQSSAVNSAHSTVPPLLNLTLSCWYAEDSPPGSRLLISTVLVAVDSPICCPVPVQGGPLTSCGQSGSAVHCHSLVRPVEDGHSPVGTPVWRPCGTPPLPSHGHSVSTCYWHPSQCTKTG